MRQFYVFLIFTTLYMSVTAYSHNQYSSEYSEEGHSLLSDDYAYEINNNCTKSGLLCKNCTELVNCIQIGQGQFLEVHVKTCAGDDNAGKPEFCLLNKCSTDPNPECTKQGASPFECHNTGVFPDPTDCRLYHMCVEKKENIAFPAAPTVDDDSPAHIGVKCLDDYGYNPITTYCDKKLMNGLCSGTPVPVCKDPGQAGAIPGTSMFYVCMDDDEGNLVPELYMCPHGTKFINGGCA